MDRRFQGNRYQRQTDLPVVVDEFVALRISWIRNSLMKSMIV